MSSNKFLPNDSAQKGFIYLSPESESLLMKCSVDCRLCDNVCWEGAPRKGSKSQGCAFFSPSWHRPNDGMIIMQASSVSEHRGRTWEPASPEIGLVIQRL